jgi:hypothetical protein
VGFEQAVDEMQAAGPHDPAQAASLPVSIASAPATKPPDFLVSDVNPADRACPDGIGDMV